MQVYVRNLLNSVAKVQQKSEKWIAKSEKFATAMQKIINRKS